MLITNIINCLLTVGIVTFAFLQWRCSDKQRKTELFKYRIKHIQELKSLWLQLSENIDYVKGYKASFNVPADYKPYYKRLSKILDDHLEFTKCYFSKDVYLQEEEFVSSLFDIIPGANVDASICQMEVAKFDILNEKFEKLCNDCFATIKSMKSLL